MINKNKWKPKRSTKDDFLSEIDSIDESSSCKTEGIPRMSAFNKRLRQISKKNRYLTDDQLQSCKDHNISTMINESQYEADQEMAISDLSSDEQIHCNSHMLKRRRQDINDSGTELNRIRKITLHNNGISSLRESQSYQSKFDKSQLYQIEGFNSSIENQESDRKK